MQPARSHLAGSPPAQAQRPAAAEAPAAAASEPPTRQQILQFMTTEHFVLQNAKSAIVAETTGRASIYLGAVSSAVVALAFIGQVSEMGAAFRWFGMVLFPSLLFLGIATFVRIHQASIENTMHAHRIHRIRHFYVEAAPEMAPYFEGATHDDMIDVLEQMAIFVPERPGLLWGLWQRMLTISGAVGVINSVLAGVFAGMLLRLALERSQAASVAVGVVGFALSLALHMRHQVTTFEDAKCHIRTLFPGPRAHERV